MIATLGLSGLRAHEVAGLRRRHLDFTHGRIVIEDGKTHRSVREVHMPPFLREELLLYVAELRPSGADDLLFPTKRGTPHSRQNLNRRVLAPAIARAAQARAAREDSVLPPAITPHTLRRSFVTLSAQAGRSASWIQAQIGHADMTTMQRYYMQASRSEWARTSDLAPVRTPDLAPLPSDAAGPSELCGLRGRAAEGMGSRVELFEQIRRDREFEGLSIHALARRHGVHRRDGSPGVGVAAAAVRASGRRGGRRRSWASGAS